MERDEPSPRVGVSRRARPDQGLFRLHAKDYIPRRGNAKKNLLSGFPPGFPFDAALHEGWRAARR